MRKAQKQERFSRLTAGTSDGPCCVGRPRLSMNRATGIEAANAGAERRKLRILVAEDNIPSRIAIDAILRREGHDVAAVGTGLEAIEAVRQGTFDLVFMDIDMPEMDGIAASRAIRKLAGRLSFITILALTGADTRAEIDRCRDAGMDGYLAKPINRIGLRRAIDDWSTAGFAVAVHEVARTAVRSDVDFATLGALEDQIGHSDILTLLDASYREIPTAISAVEAATKRRDINRCAHQLISMSGYLGCAALTHRGQELIDAIKTDEPDLAPFIAKLKTAARRTQKAIRLRYPELAQLVAASSSVTRLRNRQLNHVLS
jgi:CheY-like chemotaxis protein/HPt (histidine-containing phosphotransfer) domain-containing protein